jgi:hypothetical protein
VRNPQNVRENELIPTVTELAASSSTGVAESLKRTKVDTKWNKRVETATPSITDAPVRREVFPVAVVSGVTD